MCHVPVKSGRNDAICVYCGSINHISSKCLNRPNDNREEPRSTPRDLQSQSIGSSGNKSHVPNQSKDSHHHTRFNKRYNRQYLPNYNNIQPLPVGSILGLDLSVTLIELANIQSRSLEMIAASPRSQQEAFHELMRASRDKANDAMLANIKSYDGEDRQVFEDWINEIDQACQVSEHDFRTEIIKKLTGVARQVVMSCRDLSNDALLNKLRSCFSVVPTMNGAREELRNMRRKEHKSITVYTYGWGQALLRSSGICPEDERHPHVIKDFVTSLKKNIRNKIANRWAEMRNPPRTIQEAFRLADNVESQLQVADSFKLEMTDNFHHMEVNEMSAEEASGNEFEVNEMSRGKRWGNNNNNNYKCSNYSNNCNFNSRPQYNKPQDNKQGRPWRQKGKDSKITLTQESAHFVPTDFSNDFFRQIDLAMKIKWEELKKKGISSTQVNKITKGEVTQAKEQMQRERKVQRIRKFVSLTTQRVWTRTIQQLCRRKRKRGIFHTNREYKRDYI